MGLGLPDGGHLTHGYYVSLIYGVPSCVHATEFKLADCQEEDDGFLDLLPVLPVRYPRWIEFNQL